MTIPSFPLHLVDVFTDVPLFGNPVAVIEGAGDLETDVLQRLTRWFNLSETTFLLSPTVPEADYRVRIFTLERELPFAGHPTLGTCAAWLESGGQPKRSDVIVQECGAGLVPLQRQEGRLSFAAPPLIRSGPVAEAEILAACEIIDFPREQVLDAAWVDNGPGWFALLLPSAEAVLALNPKRPHPQRIDFGVVGAYPAGSEVAFELRAFFSDPYGKVLEDPVTGSLNASIAQWFYATGRVNGPYIAGQGTRLDRRGRIYLQQDKDGQVWVGGGTLVLSSGRLSLPHAPGLL